jgi:hypothetical protein
MAADRPVTAPSAWLDGQKYPEGRFTAGDLIMTTVLRELAGSGTLSPYDTPGRNVGGIPDPRRLSPPARSPPGIRPCAGGTDAAVSRERTGVTETPLLVR